MNRLIRTGFALLLVGACLQPARAGEVLIYTGHVNWITKEAADAQALICFDKLSEWGVDVEWYHSDAQVGDVAT
ncbi:MAG: hypothetical protein JXA90_05435, partial [Planctomycetes bacterium]|nr:hypothetical protein [Planctomycetota bacterium]